MADNDKEGFYVDHDLTEEGDGGWTSIDSGNIVGDDVETTSDDVLVVPE